MSESSRDVMAVERNQRAHRALICADAKTVLASSGVEQYLAPLHFLLTEVVHMVAAGWAVWLQLYGIMFSIKARYFGELGIRRCMDEYIEAYFWQSLKLRDHLEFKCNHTWSVSEDVYTRWSQTVRVVFDNTTSSMETIRVSMRFEEQIIAGGGYFVMAVFIFFCAMTFYSFIFVFVVNSAPWDFRKGSYLVAVWKLKEQAVYQRLVRLGTYAAFSFLLFVFVLFLALDFIGHGDTTFFICQTNLFSFCVMCVAIKKLTKTLNVVSEQSYEFYEGETFSREYTRLLETNDEFAIHLCKREPALAEEQYRRAKEAKKAEELIGDEDTCSESQEDEGVSSWDVSCQILKSGLLV